MKERQHIYRLAIPTLAAGVSVVDLPLKLDSDAPFTARAISFVNADGGVLGNDVKTGVRFRGPSGLYRSNDFVPASVMCPDSGRPTNGGGTGSVWRPLYPQITWPANATIEVSVSNGAGTSLAGMAVLFRGVKQFPDSMEIPGSSQYPQTFSSIPFDLPRYHSLPEVGVLNNIALNAPADAAIAIRGALVSVASLNLSTDAQSYKNLKIQIQDCNHKSYMNDDIEIDWVLGSVAGANMKLFFPQIWLPPSGIMYYRLVRSDTGLGALNFNVTWKASKVWPK